MRAVQRYGGSLIVSAIALWMSVALGPLIARSNFVVFHVAVVLIAVFWGLGPALMTGVIGIVGIDYFLVVAG